MSEMFFADRVRETCVAVGAGPLALAGAVPGFRRFAEAVPAGAVFLYAIAGEARREQWETGTGSIDAEGRLVRVPAASSAGGGAVDFATGLKMVTLSVGAGWYAAADQDPDAGALRAAMGLAGAAPEFSHDDYFSLYFKRRNTPPGTYPKWTDFRFTSSDGATLWGLTGFPASSSSDFFIQGKSGMRLQALDAGSAVSLSAGGATVARFVAEGVAAGADNGRSLGTPTMRFSTVYAGSGSISTSDGAEKKYVGTIPDQWLDAWGDVGWRRFKFRAAKGAGGGRRWHIGLIAQRVHGAFERRGIDGFAIGLLCRDVIADGERWGLRYDECLAIEAAWQRRELARIEQRLEQRIAVRLAGIEAASSGGR